MIEFRALGPLGAEGPTGSIDLGSFRQRALLAYLLMHANSVVSTDRLLDEMWPEDGGADKHNALWVYVSGLRSALEPERAQRSEGTVLLTRSPGYVLVVPESMSDVDTFERLCKEGRGLVDADPVRAATTLRQALGLWRGRPYEEFTYEPWATAEIHRLEELRLLATEARIDADLRSGMGAELVPELEGLLRDEPLREGFVGQLMLALHRAGRTAEALRVFSAHASRLGSELGLDPGRALVDLEGMIITDDPSLLPTRLGALPGGGLAVRGYELREEMCSSPTSTTHRAFQPAVGREVMVKVVSSEVADDPGFVRRFESEAQLIARLEHPHIAPLYDYWREPGAAFLVTPLLRGGSLADVVARSALEPDRAAAVFSQVGDALYVAHRQGIVHGNISPSSVLLDDAGNGYLSDFGVALQGSEAGPPPEFRAPEWASGVVDPRLDTYALAVVAAQALTGLSGEYEALRGALPAVVRGVLDVETSTVPADRHENARLFALRLAEALGSAPEEESGPTFLANPYKGLRSFEASDAGDFHGRERVVERLLSRVGSDGGRFTAVVGPSGSGKSSVVKAGLLPALHAGAVPGSGEWFTSVMTPGTHPFESLELALMAVATHRQPGLLGMLGEEAGISRAIAAVLPEGSRLILVVDQFEELYTLSGEAESVRFIDALVDLANAPADRCRLVVTLRADFYDRPLRTSALGELVRTGTEVITPMSREELRRAITQPAGAVGVEVAPEVLGAMISETRDQPGALPLLQFALTELFDQRVGRRITTDIYEAAGGVTGSLLRRADALLDGLPTQASATARQVFLRLVSLGDEGSSDTRRRILVSELDGLGPAAEIDGVLETFGRHRLLSFDRDPVSRAPTVEISHESLLTEWGVFRAWIDEARQELAEHRRIRESMSEWQSAGMADEYLLSGGRLDRADAWLGSSSISASDEERGFIERSREHQRAAEAQEAARAEETLLATEQAKRRGRQVRVLGVTGLVIALLAITALAQWRQAQASRDTLAGVQAAVGAANLSISTLKEDPALAALFALEAMWRTADSGFVVPEAVDAAHWSLHALGATYPVDDSTPRYVRLAPDGARGVWGVSPAALVELIRTTVGDRTLTAEECSRLPGSGVCTGPVELEDAGLLGGVDSYASQATWDQVTLRVIAPGTALEGETLRVLIEAATAGPGFSVAEVLNQGAPTIQLREGTISIPVAFVAQPGGVREFARDRGVVDLGAVVPVADLEAAYGSYLVSIVTGDGDDAAEGAVLGIPVKADLKTMMWGIEGDTYGPWASWDEFERTIAEIKADGMAPFCFGSESGNHRGWPATDLIENFVLRNHGPDVYDQWVAHEIPFDDPRIVSEIARLGHLAADGAFYGEDPALVPVTFFAEAGVVLWTRDERACAFVPLASFLDVFFADIDPPSAALPFPAFNAEYADAAVIGAMFAVALEDRPEVRDLLEVIASPEWGRSNVTAKRFEYLPIHLGFDLSLIESDAYRAMAELARAGIRSGAVRFDASDLMPPDIGGIPGAAFYEGMNRLFNEVTSENVDALALDIAQEIEAAWLALEEAAEGDG